MRRRGRPTKRRVLAESSIPAKEHMDEYVNVPIPPPVPSEPSQAGPSCPPEPAGVYILLDQMVWILATTLRRPREPTVFIERARKLGARNYDRIGDPEKAWPWLEGNERVFSVMGCSDEQMVTYFAFLLIDRAHDWWKAVQRRLLEGVSWTQFKEEFMAYLILLDIYDFDVILGMDWLSRHHATVDCYRKEVRIYRLGETEIVF